MGGRTLAAIVLPCALLASVPTAAQADDAQSIRAARATAAVKRELSRHPGETPTVKHIHGTTEVDWGNAGSGVAVVLDSHGRPRRIWHGWAASWPLARGEPGVIGGRAAALWVYLPLSVLFLVPLVERRLFSLRNLDWLALIAFGIPLALFNMGHLTGAAVTALVLLSYLGARMVALGTRRAAPRASPGANIPTRWLAAALLPLCLVRVVLDLTSPLRLDVGFFSLAGAYRLAHNLPIYGFGILPPGADHYGPVAYAAYVPFELLLPLHGQSDPAAAHWAGITFDLLTIAGLYVVGRRWRDRQFGVLLAYCWATLPLTLIALCTHANDGVVALLVVAALLTLERPALNGVVLGLAVMTKIAPVLLVPLFLTHPGLDTAGWARRAWRFAAGFATAIALALAPALAHSSPQTLYQALVGWEAVNISPFSVWGLADPSGHSYLTYLIQSLLTAGVLIASLVFACRPRRRTALQLVALSAALLIGIQLPANYWLFTYALWFVPLVFVALAPSRARHTLFSSAC
jgi:hypothetical protein